MHLEEAEGRVVWVSKPSSSAQLLAIVDAVRSGQYRTQREVAQALNLDDYVVTRAKATAIDKGLITREGWRAGLEGPTPLSEDF